MKKKPLKKTKKTVTVKFDVNRDRAWREAAVALARCVVATLQADGKIGMGSGMVMRMKDDGKTVIERWDKPFHEALALIGIEVVEKPLNKKRRRQASLSALDA